MCEREFHEEWMRRAHMKTHEKFKCEQCEKSFKYLDIKKKHVLISHENVKLYCHYYNNEKTCPFEDECIFLHEDAKYCKYNLICERNFCMFKHRKNVNPDVERDAIESVKNDLSDDDIEEEDDNNILDNSMIDRADETANKTFSNPSQVNNSGKMIKCEVCDFRSARKSDVMDHKTETHNWCHICFSSFVTQDRLKEHLRKKHNKL